MLSDIDYLSKTCYVLLNVYNAARLTFLFDESKHNYNNLGRI